MYQNKTCIMEMNIPSRPLFKILINRFDENTSTYYTSIFNLLKILKSDWRILIEIKHEFNIIDGFIKLWNASV